ncbi:hypothetical protein ACFORH_39075 [Amycolatopsis roodepoortensis]|uniref:Uncharacterized protein n=1 Tax=Amycolatopsis roodepoortensis TaxID=700274 RepID=A0ABR9LIN7_9PSEU|nr:hypothetical protein [Amycolatopsis roodepoortensis]MBE1580518.1 hypothetical protein [Amycolatopsis roodepoortensis]
MSKLLVVAVARGVVDRVAESVDPEASEWWAAELDRVRAIRAATERREARAALEEERDRRRRGGEHNDTNSAVVLYQLLVELDSRGWLHRDWDPVEPGHARLGGRPWGVQRGSRGELPERLQVWLPEDVFEVLRRSTWHVSAPSVRRLQQLASLPRPLSEAQVYEAARLRREVVTTADVVRSAANRLEVAH